jgi:UDP-N-acetylmuramoyl-tripeptide--D-alanyl-D-alanine ligase
MQPTTVSQLAHHAGASILGDPDVLIGPDVVIDSRAATPGCLFVALPGERVDGHDFAVAAVEAGAAALLVSRPVEVPVEVTVPQLVVADTATALALLATGVVAEAVGTGLTSIGITGSSGKTSTKDLVAQVLATAAETVAPAGSANNEIGVPLTACRVDASTRFLVNELGARGRGHIAWLCGIVRPSVGAVLNVGHAHLGEFGSVDAIAQAKGELVEALPDSGWAVLNADDERVVAMASRTPARIATFATSGEPEVGELRVWADAVTADARQRPTFRLHASGVAGGTADVRLQVSGLHQVANALAAAAIGLSQGLTVPGVAEALTRAVPRSRWRMELVERDDGLLVVNDAYNANPESMAAALRAVASMRRETGRLVAVLGDMLELGPGAAAEHRAVGELAGRLGFDQVVALGEYAEDLASGVRSGGVPVTVAANPGEAVRVVAMAATGRDVVLVKASRGLALETVAEQLGAGPATEVGR